MKVTRGTQGFNPVNLTLESKDEFLAVVSALATVTNSDVQDVLMETYGYSKDEAYEVAEEQYRVYVELDSIAEDYEG